MNAPLPVVGPVESGISIPPRYSFRSNTAMGRMRRAISEMKPGESRLLGDAEGALTKRFSAHLHRAAELEKTRITTRRTTDGKMRVWRLK